MKPIPYDNQLGQETIGFLTDWVQKNIDDCDDVLCEIDAHKPLILGLSACSPYLSGLIKKFPAYFSLIISENPDDLLTALLKEVKDKSYSASSVDEVKSILRQSKSKIALLTGYNDVGGIWGLDNITFALSHFADLCLDISLVWLIHGRMERGDLPWPDGEPVAPNADLTLNSGFTILALGKLGGNELNYSSDIDIIPLFDEQKVVYTGRKSVGDCFVKITRDLIKMLHDRTADGYVFRVDLRLRPDPGATPIAMSMAAAEAYYQSIGQNWERSAYIKARPSAGDIMAGHGFIERLRPFIWRKNLDFASIEDIHRIKTQVHEHHKHGEICVAGHDVKLGRGGIREIEFFTQIHQLISGGREWPLRQRRTLSGLRALLELDKIPKATHSTLMGAYIFLRTLEHRLQMINDEQTHSVPSSEEGIKRVSMFMGFTDVEDFSTEFITKLTLVKIIYDTLLAKMGMGTHDDENVVIAPEKLEELGFADAKQAIDIINEWRSGRYKALRTERARRFIEKCLGVLLKAFGGTSSPNRALSRFDNFLSKLPAGVQIFALFQANTWLFDVMARIMGNAPLLAEHLSRRPHLFDSVLDPGFFHSLPDETSLKTSLDFALRRAKTYEDKLDVTRRWTNDMRFGVGVHLLEGLITTNEAGGHWCTIADTVLHALLPEVQKNFEVRNGLYKDGELALIAMGSYGGKAMTFTSDLDIIMLYDAPKGSTSTKGLSPSQYFSRLGQQMITAITVLTSEGLLYDVDLRLRPSGSKGPLVVTLETFEDYQMKDAWAFEHMALTRARLVTATKQFEAAILNTIQKVLTKKRKTPDLLRDIQDMHKKIKDNYPTDSAWDVRNAIGGLVDIEFIIQYLLLKNGHKNSQIFDTSLFNAMDHLVSIDVLLRDEQTQLIKALKIQTSIIGILRLCYEKPSKQDDFSKELKLLLAQGAEEPDFEALKNSLEQSQNFVHTLFQQTIGEPDN
jgi:glutamate-ammonia-ligase adenylyltransferase